MKYLIHVTMMVLLLSSNSCADEQQFVMAFDQPITQLAPINTIKEQLENELYTLPTTYLAIDESEYRGELLPVTRRISILEAFQSFVRIFLILLNNPRVRSVKTVEEVIVNLVQIGLQAIKINTIKPQGNTQHEIAENILKTDPGLKSAFTITISRSASSYNPTPILKGKTHTCCCEKTPKEQDKTTRVVLSNFAIIANHFINILQDPENSDNVAPNLIGMLERIVTIGTEVIKSGKLTIDTDEQAIVDYVQQLDDNFKEELITTIYRTVQRRYLQ